MMRRVGCAAGLALLAGGCGAATGNDASRQAAPPGPQNQAAAPAGQPAPDPLAPVEVSVTVQEGACRVAIRNQAGDGAALLARAVAILEESIRAQERQSGTVQAIPPAVLRGAPDAPWRCTGGAIYQLLRAGFAQLIFRPAQGEQIAVDLPVEANAPPPPIEPARHLIAILADGNLQWNGAAVTAERLDEYLRSAASARPMPELAIEPAAEARLDAATALLARMRAAGIELASSDRSGGVPSVGFAGIERYAGELK